MRPLLTCVSSRGTLVSTPQKPEMQSQMADLAILPLISQPFSSSVWGEWSVAIMSIAPSSKPCHSASWCSFERTGGVHFQERTDILHVRVDPQQVVRLSFASEPQAASLGIAKHLHRLLGRGMHDVQLGAEVFREEHSVRDRFRLA